jgi:hypothetical protein
VEVRKALPVDLVALPVGLADRLVGQKVLPVDQVGPLGDLAGLLVGPEVHLPKKDIDTHSAVRSLTQFDCSSILREEISNSEEVFQNWLAGINESETRLEKPTE